MKYNTTEDEGCDDFVAETPPIMQRERTNSNLRIIAQQQSLFDDIKKKIEENNDWSEDNNDSTSSDVDSEKAIRSKRESPDSQQVLRPPQDESSLGMSLSSSGETPKQKHIKDTFVGKEISCRASTKSRQELHGGNNQSEIRSSDAHFITLKTSAIEEPTLASPASPNAWSLMLEHGLEEHLSNLQVQDEFKPHATTTAELKSPPETLTGDSGNSGADSSHVRLPRGNYPGQDVPLPLQALPQRLDGDHDVGINNMDDRKPKSLPATSTSDSGVDSTHVRLMGGNYPGQEVPLPVQQSRSQLLSQRLDRDDDDDDDYLDDRKTPANRQDDDAV